MIKVSDYIFDYFLSKGIDTIFCVAGGAAAHLLESAHNKGMKMFHCHHEQACAMAAEGYTRISNKPAIVLVTNGPGSTNTITGVLGAYQDSIPMIVISGQVTKNQTLYTHPRGLRQLGVQECDIIPIVTPITKFAKQLLYENDVTYYVSKAYTLATTGRQGPVWLDIPLDLQAEMIPENGILYEEEKVDYSKYNIKEIVDAILKAEKPLIVAGNGIHLSKTEEHFKNILNGLYIPVITTWNAKDLFYYDDHQFVGSFGILGERAANLAVQEADLLLILGSRMSIPNIGYNTQLFSPNSIKIMVDIDQNELEKRTLKLDYAINEDLKIFFEKLREEINNSIINFNSKWDKWSEKCNLLKNKHPVYQESYSDASKDGINSYYFIEELSKHLKDNHVVVTDMGTAFTCTMQAMRMNGKARLFTSSGTSSMGYGLPAAIGAWVADPTKEIILIAGDGGFQMNIQELQTVRHYNIPIKIFILNNNGYLAISLMQDNLFKGNKVGSTPESGISSPDFVEIAKAYGIWTDKASKIGEREGELGYELKWALGINKFYLCEIKLPSDQLMLPRVQSYKDPVTGQINSSTLDKMYPFI